ncbi:CBS domain-containing protein [Stieleria varia]|uniref:CBS domain protein n=1 Tax=Stieleria varia TaxID=2528005 RepID=A0A5C6B7R9_9BACT|nr:CBS domain-containing protein [Stieleria varia]TWU08123.1 CBS domain protein [Stieleria varia]
MSTYNRADRASKVPSRPASDVGRIGSVDDHFHSPSSLDDQCACLIDSVSSDPIDADTSIRTATEALYRSGCPSLYVVDNDELVGVFGESEVLERVAEIFEKVADQPVREVMTQEPVVLSESAVLRDVLSAFSATGYRPVPVVTDDGRLVGEFLPQHVLSHIDENGFLTASRPR